MEAKLPIRKLMRAALFYDLGVRDYREVWDFQKELVERRIAGEIPDTVIFCEHFPVFTIGKHGGHDNIRSGENLLEIPIYEVERGGNITFHGLGQLVAYFIFKVQDVHEFTHEILQSGVDLLSEYGISAYIKKGYPGVWVGDEKIASVGIAVRKWITFHGIAINVNVDLRYFDMIVPCGIQGVKMTSLEKIIGRKISMDEVKEIYRGKLEKNLKVQFVEEALRL